MWLVKRGEEVALHLGGPAEPGRELAKGHGWKEAILDGERVWLLAEDAGKGQLLSTPVTGGAPAVTLSDLRTPASLTVRAGRLYWLEYLPAALPAFAHIPAATGKTLLRAREPDGTVRQLGEWRGAQPPSRGDLAVGDTRAYVRLRRVMATEFHQVDLGSGEASRVAVEEGTQESLLSGDDFFWTAPSEEASYPTGMRSVRQRGSNGSTRLLTDWLPSNGMLQRAGGEVYYASDKLYRIPRHLDEPRAEGPLPPGDVTSDGKQMYLLNATTGPSVLQLP